MLSNAMTPTAANPSLFDLNGLTALKRQAKGNDPQALKAAAQQFEALFLQMVLKSMRDATPKEGMFDSEQTRMYESLLDQQMAQVLAGKGGTGLAAVIEKQLARTADPAGEFEDGLPLMPPARSLDLRQPARPLPLPTTTDVPLPLAPAPVMPAAPAAGADAAGSPAQAFVGRVLPHAEAASRATGIPAAFLVAQAALETGWGRSEPRYADGRPSHNLFGIKAGKSWTGPVVEAVTTEYVDGVAQQRVERFRAYGSYAEAFRDHAELLLTSPRYGGVVGARDAATFAQGLQRAGYATDPAYGAKLERIIGGQTLRSVLATA